MQGSMLYHAWAGADLLHSVSYIEVYNCLMSAHTMQVNASYDTHHMTATTKRSNCCLSYCLGCLAGTLKYNVLVHVAWVLGPTCNRSCAARLASPPHLPCRPHTHPTPILHSSLVCLVDKSTTQNSVIADINRPSYYFVTAVCMQRLHV